MKIYYLIFAFFVVLFDAYSYAADADFILDVSINGLHNVKSKNILSLISSESGKRYSSDTVKKDVCSILESGYFDNVDVIFNDYNGNLIFDVTEKPYIEQIIFKGNSEFSKSRLGDISLLKKNGFYDLLKLEETKKEIFALYVNKGYTDCQIEVHPDLDADTNKIIITFLITENNKIIVSEIKIEGIISFNKKKIIKLMKTESKKVFKEELYKSDLMSIQAFYQNNGFMDYQLISLNNIYNETRTEVILTFSISEGNRYKIGSIVYNGNFAVNNKEIEKIIEFKKGQVFEQLKISNTINRICEIYFNKGYLNIVVDKKFNKKESTGIVDISLSINENSLIHLENIYINGLNFVNDKIIRREILVKPGNVLSYKKVHESIKNINALKFIENVESQVLYREKSDIADLVFCVTELKSLRPLMINLGTEFSTYDNFVGVTDFRYINISGHAQEVCLFSEINSKRQEYEMGWIEPWIFNRDISLLLSIFGTNRIRNYNSIPKAFKENIIGTSIKIIKEIKENTELILGYTFEKFKYLDFDNVLLEKDFRDSFDQDKDKISSIFAECIYDSIDCSSDPSKGNRQSLYIQLTNRLFGGDINFVKGTAQSTWFFPTFWKFILSINMKIGGIISHDESYCRKSSIPYFERFINDEIEDIIRGFDYRVEIGPTKGGIFMGLINVEYKFPIVTYNGKSVIQGVMFYDIGGNWHGWKCVNLILGERRENLHSSAGFGVRLITPIFPLKIDFGFGFRHKYLKEVPSRNVHISFGGMF
jgi:outer membrane protein insertion porin family